MEVGKINKDKIYSLVIFIIAQFIFLMELFTKASIIISLISLVIIILILSNLIPISSKSLIKNTELEKIISNKLLPFVILIIFIRLDYSLMETASLKDYILLQCLLIFYIVLDY